MNIKFENFNDFISLEKSLTDSFSVRLMYVDMVDDLISGLLLSQIVYWYSPSKSQNNKHANKLRVEKDGYLWIAKQRGDWWEEIRITPRQYDRARGKLEKQNLIKVTNYKFNGMKTQHIRLLVDNFLNEVQRYIDRDKEDSSDSIGFNKSVKPDLNTDERNSDVGIHESVKPELTKRENGSSQKCKTGLTESVTPLTKTTNSINNKNNNKGDLKKIVDNFSTAFNKTPNSLQIQVIQKHISQGLSKELIIKTIRSCGLGGHNQTFFFNKLKRLVDDNIFTVDDLDSNISQKNTNKPATNKSKNNSGDSNYKWKDFFIDFDKYKE